MRPEAAFVDFFREDVYDEDEVLVELARQHRGLPSTHWRELVARERAKSAAS